MDQHEEWRPVRGFPDYQVSSLGRIGSARRGSYKILHPFLHKDGYLMIKLYDSDGARIKRPVHHLVAEAFVGPRPAGMQVRHLDGSRANNTPGNLAWGTASENVLDQVRHGTHRHARKTTCPQGHPYSSENTEVKYDGARRCRTCHRAHVRASTIRRALRAASVPSERAA